MRVIRSRVPTGPSRACTSCACLSGQLRIATDLDQVVPLVKQQFRQFTGGIPQAVAGNGLRRRGLNRFQPRSQRSQYGSLDLPGSGMHQPHRELASRGLIHRRRFRR